MPEKKIALVTGANRGIGHETAKQLLKNDFKVIATFRRDDAEDNLKKALPGDVYFHQLDVTKQESINRLVKDLSSFSKIDVLVNNAGIIGQGSALDVPMDDVKKVMETNFYGPWRMVQALLPLLKKSSDARIINVSSGMGALEDMGPGYAPYRMSKSSLIALTVLLSAELESSSIKTNVICPGWVKTDMGGQGAPREVKEGADTITWLATADKIPNGKFLRDRKVIPW